MPTEKMENNSTSELMPEIPGLEAETETDLDPATEERGWLRAILHLDAFFGRLDAKLLAIAMVACAGFASLDFLLRNLGLASSPWFDRIPKYSTLAIAMIGASLASRQGHHIAIDILNRFAPPHLGKWFTAISDCVIALICTYLTYASFEFIQSEYHAGSKELETLPTWIIASLIIWGFSFCAFRFSLRAIRFKPWLGIILLIGAAIGCLPGAVDWFPERYPDAEKALELITPLSDFAFSYLPWGAGLVIVVGLLTGMPLFGVLGGIAMLGFWMFESPIAAVPPSVYQLLDAPALVTLPLFTLMGAVLAKGSAPSRLVRVARAWIGWAPGGLAIAAVVVCAFFTTFSGASGVTILALGVLLHQMLAEEGYSDNASLGLVTASGSIGLLFAPALPLIMYAIFAKVDIDHMFLAGILPGCLLIVAVSGVGVVLGRRGELKRHPFEWEEAKAAFRGAIWELFLPLLVLGLLIFGFADVTEAAAVGAVYTLIIVGIVHKDLDLKTEMGPAITESGVLIGAVLVIVGLALALVGFLVDVEIPQAIVAWAKANISSKIVFLLYTNLLLLVVGCLLDILSAIVIFVPLLVPVAVLFDVHPVHFGIIFLANLEIGYLTPPVGMNLFLSSFRFNKELPVIWKTVVPYLAVLFVALLIITYVPWLSTAFVDLTPIP